PRQSEAVDTIVGRGSQTKQKRKRQRRIMVLDVCGIGCGRSRVLSARKRHRRGKADAKREQRAQLHLEPRKGMERHAKLNRPIVRKSRRISFPLSVRIDSGWNCTPHTGYRRCLSAWISVGSSLARATTSSSSGSESD